MSDQQFDNRNRGVLFREFKKKHPKAPDWTGTLDIDGTEHRISAWIKTSKKGTEFLSLKRETEDWKSKSQPKPETSDDPW